jgi:hypothetical protein
MKQLASLLALLSGATAALARGPSHGLGHGGPARGKLDDIVIGAAVIVTALLLGFVAYALWKSKK